MRERLGHTLALTTTIANMLSNNESVSFTLLQPLALPEHDPRKASVFLSSRKAKDILMKRLADGRRIPDFRHRLCVNLMLRALAVLVLDRQHARFLIIIEGINK
jgi:hypothetical protein